jgi:hypothetical protein
MIQTQPMPVIDIASGKPFELLLATTLKGLKNSDTYASQVTYILSKPELLELVKSFEPQDAIELLLTLQFLIGYLWSAERLSRGNSFGDFSNLSLRAADLLIRYKAVKLKKSSKKDMPHETLS